MIVYDYQTDEMQTLCLFFDLYEEQMLTGKKLCTYRHIGRDSCPLHKQCSQQINMFCMTNKHLVTLTSKIILDD